MCGVCMQGRQRGRAGGNGDQVESLSREAMPEAQHVGHELPQRNRAVRAPTDAIPASLEEANKLIFVQDFDGALENLKTICRAQPWHVEAHFRLVELGVRLEREEDARELYEELGTHADSPSQRACSLARCLLEIRLMERRETSSQEGRLINPSLHTAAPQLVQERTVEGAGTLFPDGESRFPAVLGRSFLGTPVSESLRRGYMIGKSVRVARSPLVADDLAPIDLNEQETLDFETFAHTPEASENEPGILTSDAAQAEVFLEMLNQKLVDNPDDYAVWYVHGCACELAGNLHAALESWKRAFAFKSDSLAVLATLAELQQIGALGTALDVDYGKAFEVLDRFAVHGTYETHLELYREFLGKGNFRLAIAALRTLADWLQRQKGSVPPEVEILCLLGAMQAYRLEGNSGAAESARREAENLAVSFKKSTSDFEGLTFVAARAEDFDLPSLARTCYFSVLVSNAAPRETVVKVAGHCVAHYPSRSLAECLRTAYYNFAGDHEIRFCQVLCSLSLSGIPVKAYLDRKNRIRELLSRDDYSEALSLLQHAVGETDEDPEVHYYLAEMYSRMDAEPLAARHYAAMYALDPLNGESVLRYIQFLLKTKHYEESESCARSLLATGILSRELEGEVHWTLAAASFAREQVEFSRIAVGRALECDPWNMTFLALAIRLYSPALLSQSIAEEKIQETDNLLRQFEDSVLGVDKGFSEDLLSRWVTHAAHQIRQGYVHFAFLMACAAYRAHYREPEVLALLAAAGAAHDTRLAAQRIMLLLASSKDRQSRVRQERALSSAQPPALNLGHLALTISCVYAAAGEWSLVAEWVEISLRSGPDDPARQTRLMMLEAECLLFGGVHLGRCRSLLEAVLDSLDKSYINLDEAKVMLGYVMVLQGELKQGAERIEQALGSEPSIKSLFFFVKACERTGASQVAEDSLLRAFALSPTTPLEVRLLNELHLTVGSRRSGAIVNLVC